VEFKLSLLDSNHPEYFFKLKVAQKLAQVLSLKETATRFFKSGQENRFKKAADLY